MDLPQLATFKYKHGGRVLLSGKRKIFFVVSLALAVIFSLAAFPAGLVAFMLPLVAFLSRPSKLLVGPRYFICGDEIFYYANIRQLKLYKDEGKLSLQTAGGKTFTLEREKFPTNARKANKIAANKAAKFGKVSTKIIDKVHRFSPEVIGG